MTTEVSIRKWGHSLGIILPKDIITSQNLKPDERIVIDIVKKIDLSKSFGRLKDKSISGEELKKASLKNEKVLS